MLRFFEDNWNTADVLTVILSILAVILYVVKWMVVRGVTEEINLTKGNRYIRLSYPALLNQIYEYLLSMTVFFSTIKFSKLLSFQKAFMQIAATIKLCFQVHEKFFCIINSGMFFISVKKFSETAIRLSFSRASQGLSTFVIEFTIVFGAFCSFFYFVLKNDLENFRDFVRTAENTMAMSIGKFNFGALRSADEMAAWIFFVFSSKIAD